MKILQKLFVIILIIIFIMAFSSSYLSLSIDNLAYVLAIGIDKFDDTNLQVTFQFSTTAPATETGSTKKTPTVTNSVKASSISSAINLMNAYMGKQLNMSHCKVIIFSEELASQGISDEVYTLINDSQVRPSANIIISKCPAKYYIEQTSPELENLVSKYYEILTNSSTYTGFMPDSTIGDFFNTLNCTSCEPTAILGGLTIDDGKEKNITNTQENYNIKSNEAPIEGQHGGTENIGLAVFKADALVGELTASETISYLAIRNRLNRFLISIPNPSDSSKNLDIYLTPKNSTKIEVDTSNSSPYVKVNASFTGRIYSMSEDAKYLDPKVLENISEACNRYLELQFSQYLYKTAKDFKADINGVGRSVLGNFLTTKEFDDYNWLENYKNSFFNVEVDTFIKSGMLITET